MLPPWSVENPIQEFVISLLYYMFTVTIKQPIVLHIDTTSDSTSQAKEERHDDAIAIAKEEQELDQRAKDFLTKSVKRMPKEEREWYFKQFPCLLTYAERLCPELLPKRKRSKASQSK